MPVIMMTSVDTLYEVTSQDTNPIKQIGAPRIEASFNGLTQMGLQSPNSRLQNRELAEASFQQQQKYLSDAAQVAVNIFNPTTTNDYRFRATLKLRPLSGQLQPFDDNSESSGLAYTLALALTWGERKSLFNAIAPPNIPIFATGCVPVDCYARPIGHLLKKIRYACQYIENNPAPAANNNGPRFYVFIPKGNLSEYENDSTITATVTSLGGKVIGVGHISEALSVLMGNAFDGGIFTNIDNGFAGLESISYEQRHLFMGREALTKELLEKSQRAIEQSYVLNVTGVSGSGKSSAVMAGLVPKLLSQLATLPSTRQLDFNPNWTLVRPSQFSHYQDLLRELLGSVCDDPTTIAHWLSLTNTPTNMAHSISQFLSEKEATDTSDYKRSLWVIDQYEEVFTHNTIPTAQAQSLFPLLAALSEQLPLLIITVLRTEYLSVLGGQASIDVQLPRRIPAKEIEHIIALQLQYHRLSTESAKINSEFSAHQQHLEHRIKNDAIGKPLTTVSYLLQQMHHKMVADDASATLLTHEHYEALNGIQGVMAQQAELAINEGLSHYPENQHAPIIHGFFEALISIDSEQQPVARALENSHILDYPQGVNALIDAFMSKGLIIDCGKGNTPKIKLAHDTLLPHIPPSNDQICWERLLEWFNQHQQPLKYRQEIEPLFLQWLASHKKDKGHLLSHPHTLKAIKRHKLVEHYSNKNLRLYIQLSLRAQKRKRFYPLSIAATLLLITSLGVWDQYFRIKTEYAAFIGERYGIPFAINSLSQSQKNARQFHYRLRYKAGNLLSLSRHNSRGSLNNDVSKDNAARWQYHYTEKGLLLKEDSFAKSGKPLTSKTYEFTSSKNIAQVRFKFHGTNKAIGDIAYQASNFEGQKKNKSQITQHRLEFNPQGFTLKRLFFNNNEQAAKDASGAYGIGYEYNLQGLVTRLQYTDIEGNNISINGVHSRAYERDAQGNISSKTWLDKNNTPILNQAGYARTTTRYDSHGNLLEKQYLKNNKDLTTHKDGFSKATASYDQYGNQIQRQFLDKQGNNVLHKWGFTRIELQYDDQGNATEWKYFDTKNKPALRNNRFARVTFAYDKLGNKTEENYFGLNDQPVLHPNGYSQFKAQYDTQGNRLTEAYFDTHGSPTLHKKGYAKVTSTFNHKNQQIKRAYFGINGEAILNQYGYAHFSAEFDQYGNRTHLYFYDTHQKLRLNRYGFAHVAINYDDKGNKTAISYYNTQGELTSHRDGIAITTIKYNQQGNIIEANYFDTNKQATLRNNNFSRIRLAYDHRGNRISEHYFDTSYQPKLHKQGYAYQKIHYDNRNNPIEWQYFGLKDEPIVNLYGYARITAEYDSQDKLVGSAYFDDRNNCIKGKGSLDKK